MTMNEFVIVSGPNREQLFDALRLLEEKRVVEFRFGPLGNTASNEKQIEVLVTGIVQDKWGNWVVSGYCVGIGTRFHAKYKTSNRSGKIYLPADKFPLHL